MQQEIGRAVARFNVGGIQLERPFKVQRLGHFGFNVDDTEACCRFYSGLLGLRITDTLDFKSALPDPSVLAGLTQTKAYFLNHGTDHHAFALFPKPAVERTGDGEVFLGPLG
jgi:catechol 2,3-dioxygenase-like lactoylglutathione lyase family enzyme